ncbi:MAG: sigma-70 family RNA polymerase sigma factor [Bacteroidota bacterium]
MSEAVSMVQGIISNDSTTLQALYTRNFVKVEKYILQNKGDASLAKDIFQEAFVAVWKNVRQGKFTPQGPSSLDGYLYQIAKNKWLDFLRSGQVKKMASLEATVAHPPSVEPELLPEETEDPRLKQAMAAYGLLGDQCQLLLKRFYFDQKSLKEIAEEVNMAPASVRNQKYRCMQKLRSLTLENQA